MLEAELKMWREFRPLASMAKFHEEADKKRLVRRERAEVGRIIIYAQGKKHTFGYEYKGVIYKSMNYNPTWMVAKFATFVKYPSSFDF
jgi:hypothetical protein